MRDCQSVCAESLISSFSLRRFEAAGVSDIAMRAARDEPLSPEDGQRLAGVSLPLLAKLVSLRPNREPCGSPGVDPVLYLPLSKWVDSSDSGSAAAKATATVHRIAAQLAELVEKDERVREFGDTVRSLHVFMGTDDRSRRGRVVSALTEVTSDAGWIRVCLSPQCERGALPCMTDDVVQSTGNGNCNDESQASNAMRAIAIAHLSANAPEIRAPVGQLGIKAAHLALSFGASHLGQVAVNDETAAHLNISTLAELADALRYDLPTPI